MFKYHDFQRECIDSLHKSVKKHKKTGVILPTGAGKTEVFQGFTSEYLEANPNNTVLILSHLSLLTTQTTKRFALRTPTLGVGILQADIMPDHGDKVVISTMQSARDEPRISMWKRHYKPKVDIVIVDEAHYLTTDSYDKALGYFPKAKVIGVTATPYREAQLMLNWFDNIAYTKSLQELIDAGFLVPPIMYQNVIDPNATPEERIANCIKIYKEKELDQPGIIYMNTIDDAKLARNAFKDAGIKCECVTSEVTGEHRDKILDDFREGNIDMLTTVNVLSAGVDLPRLQVEFMPYGTSSPTLFMQRIGRALRTHILSGKRNARIYINGDAPSIKRGVYTKLLENTLNYGDGNRETDVFDEKDFLELIGETGTQHYDWVSGVCEIAERLESLGATSLAQLLKTKNFPNRYLKNLDILKFAGQAKLAKELDDGARVNGRQQFILKQAGFSVDNIRKMDYNNANYFIKCITDMRKGCLADKDLKWILPSGKMTGHHVKDTHYLYRKAIIKTGSYEAKLIKDWWYYGKR